MRLSKEELTQKIHDNQCKYSLSWSKLHCFIDDPFSFKLKYLDHIPEERSNSYAFLGDVVHSGLESFYKNEKTIDEIIEIFENKMAEQSLSNVNFVKDKEKNKQIEQNYYQNIKHFFKNYEKVSPLSNLEIFVGWKFDDYFMQGYVDHMYPIEKEGIVVIEDFKTSTLYQGEKIEENSGQLKLYAYMISKMYNIPISKIRIGWNFLKYVMIDIKQKNGNIKTTKCLRNEIPKTIYSKLKTWGKHFKYTSEEVEDFYKIIEKNSLDYKDKNIFDGVPDEISEKFNIRDCFVNIDCTEEIIDTFIKYVYDNIKEMTDKIALYKVTKNDELFWKEVTKENSFFFINLCGYTSKNHKPLREYLNKISEFEKESTDTDNLDPTILDFIFNNK